MDLNSKLFQTSLRNQFQRLLNYMIRIVTEMIWCLKTISYFYFSMTNYLTKLKAKWGYLGLPFEDIAHYVEDV